MALVLCEDPEEPVSHIDVVVREKESVWIGNEAAARNKDLLRGHFIHHPSSSLTTQRVDTYYS